MSKAGLELEYIFHPGSIAIIGTSDDPGSRGLQFLKAYLSAGYKGKLYPVHPQCREVMGLKVYPRVIDIPGSVDHVVSAIPALAVPELLEDCGAKGVKVCHLFTAGFSETGEEDRIRLEAQVREIARKGGVRIIGPNCMGLYCPETGLTWADYLPKEAGPVALVSQSGANAAEIITQAAGRGLRFSKVISYGNATDFNEADFFEYCAHDPKTKIIAGYIEGVKDGPRFLRAVREAAAVKPVILLKGGRTEAGTRAVASHTGSLAGVGAAWEALFKQTGAVRVDSLDELVDLLVAFRFFPLPRGRNAGVIGGGGGASVLAADDCDMVGIRVPPLPPDIRKELRKFTPIAGTSISNPIDSMVVRQPQELAETIRLIASWDQIDMLLIHISVDFFLRDPDGEKRVYEVRETLMKAAKDAGKPTAIAIRRISSAESAKLSFTVQVSFAEAGISVYPSLARAASAVSKFIAYHEWRAGAGR